MSGARRAFDMIRAYVNHGWEHLTDAEQISAQQELREAIENPSSIPRQTPTSSGGAEPQISLEQARNLFDLSPNATSKQIEDAYQALRQTLEPSKFQEGSAAWTRAHQLRRRLDEAKVILLENMDPTVKRFEKLEIE